MKSKMKKYKRCLCYAILVFILFSMSSQLVCATEEDLSNSFELVVPIEAGGSITVVVPEEYRNDAGIEEKIRLWISNKNFPSGITITINRISSFSECDQINENLAQIEFIGEGNAETQAFGYQYETIIGAKSASRVIETKHIMSVAKGLTKTFGVTTVFTRGFKFISGSSPYYTAVAEFQKSYTYSGTFVFTGPPEESSNNSRNYYLDFIGATAYWTQNRYTGTGTFVDSRSGYGEICIDIIEYSHDIFVQ